MLLVVIGLLILGLVMAAGAREHRLIAGGSSAGSSQLCLAAGTWAAATHYGEHVRRPDPLEGHDLLVAAMRAAAAVRALRLENSAERALGERLVVGIGYYRRALATGRDLTFATREVVSVLDRLPPSCVFASRRVGPA